jgi:HEAT repeat protein
VPMRSVTFAVAGALLAALFVSGASGEESFDDLLARLKSPVAKTRQDAAEALGKSRRREAVGPLSALVRDPEPKVRVEVVRALRTLRDPSGVAALATSVGDGDPKIREEAIAGLVEIYSDRERATPVVGRFLEVFSDDHAQALVPVFGKVDPAVLPALATALRDEEPSIREAAALAAGILGGRAVVGELRTALQDPSASVRGAAVAAIGAVGPAEDGKALIPLLADESAAVRNRALQAIGRLKVQEAGAPLREIYEANKRKELGLRALEGLSRIGDPAQMDLFKELSQDPDLEKKRVAIEGLGRLSDPSFIAAFKKDFQRERNDEVRLAYAFALTRLGDHAFVDSLVLNLPSRTVGRRCRDYLLELGKGMLPDLGPYLSDPEAEIRAQLCEILGLLGDPGAIPLLTPLLNDPNSKVADRANLAMEKLRRAGGATP